MFVRRYSCAGVALAVGVLASAALLSAGARGASGAPGVAWNSNLAIQNLSDIPSDSVVTYFSTTGIMMKMAPLGLIPPKGTIYVDSSAIGELPPGFAGAAVVSTSQPSAVAYVGSDVVSPPSRSHYTGAGIQQGAAVNDLLDVSNGYADKVTTIVVQNPSPVPQGLTVQYIERFSGSVTAAFRQTVAPMAVHYYDSANLPARAGLPDGWTGSAIITSDGGPLVVSGHTRAGSTDQTSVTAATVPWTIQYLPSIMYEFNGNRLSSFLRLQNVAAAPTSVHITFYSDAGEGMGGIDAVIDPLQTQVFVAGSAGLPQGYRGSAVVQSSNQVAVSVRHSSAVSDLDIVYNAQPSTGQRAGVPFVQWAPLAAPGGYRTTVDVMNTLGIPVTAVVRYFDANGGLRQSPGATIPPYGVLRTDPNPFVGEGFFLGSVAVDANGPLVVMATSATIDGARGEAYPALMLP